MFTKLPIQENLNMVSGEPNESTDDTNAAGFFADMLHKYTRNEPENELNEDEQQ